jgi:hypothetical protein
MAIDMGAAYHDSPRGWEERAIRSEQGDPPPQTIEIARQVAGVRLPHVAVWAAESARGAARACWYAYGILVV